MGKPVVFSLLTIAASTSLWMIVSPIARAESQPANGVGQSTGQPSNPGLTVGQPNNGLAPQLVTTQPAVSVIGQGQVTAPADIARLEFSFSNRGSFEETTPANETVEESIEDKRRQTETILKPIVDALVAVKVPADSIRIQTSSLENPKLLLTLEKPTRERVQEVVTAVDRAAKSNRVVFLQNIGAAYALKNCLPLERAARRIALSDAQTQIRTLTLDLNVRPGELLFVTAFPIVGYPPAFSSCGSKVGAPANSLLGVSDDSLPPYDPSDPTDVQVRSQVSVTYAIQK